MPRALVGTPRRLIDKFSFRVEGAPFNASDTGFTSVSEIKGTLEVVKHRQGGSLLPEKSAGLGDYDPVTLSRGATTNIKAIAAWYQLVMNARAQTSLQSGGARGARESELRYKFPIDIVETDGGQVPIRRTRLHDAFPTELVIANGHDNTISERLMESLTLEYLYAEEVLPSTGLQFNIFAAVPGFGSLSLSSLGRASGASFQSLSDAFGGSTGFRI